MSDDTTRYVFPTQVEVGISRSQEVVGIIVKYKLSASEPEEFQQHYGLTIEQAETIANDLLWAVRELSRRQK